MHALFLRMQMLGEKLSGLAGPAVAPAVATDVRSNVMSSMHGSAAAQKADDA